MKLFAFLLVFSSLQSIAQIQTNLSDSEFLQRKQLVDENTKKQIPNLFTEPFYNRLKPTTPACEVSKFNDAILSCTYYKCLRKHSIMGITLFAEFLVHGKNRAQNCVVSGLDRRYFVPSKDLKQFSKLYWENTSGENLSIAGEFGMSGSTVVQSVLVDGKTCKIKAEYINEVDYSKSQIVRFSPPKKDGMEVTIKNGKAVQYETKNGVTRIVPEGGNPSIPKLVRYSLEKESETTCKNSGATLMLELEKQGLTEMLPSIAPL